MSSRERHNHPHPLVVSVPQGRDGQHGGVVVWVELQLFAIGADGLAKVALLVQQTHRHDWCTQIAGRLQKIAGQYAQTTAVQRQRFAQTIFHAEIGNALAQIAPTIGRIPGVSLCKSLVSMNLLTVALLKVGVCGQFFQPLPGHAVQNQPRVPGGVPDVRIKSAPELIGTVMPGPPKVQRQLEQSAQGFRQGPRCIGCQGQIRVPWALSILIRGELCLFPANRKIIDWHVVVFKPVNQ